MSVADDPIVVREILAANMLPLGFALRLPEIDALAIARCRGLEAGMLGLVRSGQTVALGRGLPGLSSRTAPTAHAVDDHEDADRGHEAGDRTRDEDGGHICSVRPAEGIDVEVDVVLCGQVDPKCC